MEKFLRYAGLTVAGAALFWTGLFFGYMLGVSEQLSYALP